MTRPHFLTSPGAYVRTQRMRQTPADANPFRKFERQSRLRAAADALWLFVGAALLVWVLWAALAAHGAGAF